MIISPSLLQTLAWLPLPHDLLRLCHQQQQHCHPGGELACVEAGEYFDADMQGNVLRTYPEGSIVFYKMGSTHRPLSLTGARLFYIPFDGIIFGKGAEDLMQKMVDKGVREEALQYALFWMFPDEAERQRIYDSVGRD